MKKIISLLVALTFVSNYSISQPGQNDIIKKADLLLDMMEYEAAIVNYLRVLSQYPQQRDVRKEIGFAYFQLGKIDESLKYIKEELEFFPDNEDAYDLLVYILYRENKLREARTFLERLDFPVILTEEDPYIGGLGCFILGMHFKEAREYSRARKYFRNAIEKGYDPVKCYVQLIDIDLISREFQTGIKYTRFRTPSVLKEAIQTCGLQPEFYFIYGLKYFKISKSFILLIHWANRCFEIALELKPDFKDAIFNLACLSYNYKDFEEAAEYFRRILKIEPENAEVKFYLNCALKKLDQSIKEESIPECPQMINFSREFIDKPDREYKHKFKNDIAFILERINHLGLEFIENGKFLGALKRFRNGLKIDPGNPGFHFNMSTVYSWFDNLEEAEKHVLIALRRRGFFGRVPYYRIQEISKKEGESLNEPLDIPLSEWTFEAALNKGNHFLDAYNLLGNIYFKKEDYERSFLAFKKVVEIYPEDSMGHFNLGCVYRALDDGKNAEKEWRDAIRYEAESKRIKKRGEISDDQLDVSLVVLYRPVSYRAFKSLGSLYLERNLQDKALKEFKKALELEPDDPEPLYEIGKIYHAKSERNEKYFRMAVDCYRRYLYLGGEKEDEVKELLKSLKQR
jgi:tetratricopeptide (TPR) repeat protein